MAVAMRIGTVLPLLGSIALSACTGSPTTLATPPDFEVVTPRGMAGVSIRESSSSMTAAKFEQLVSAGMERDMPRSLVKGPPRAPFPAQRIVWHVDTTTAARGVLRLEVNVFNGSYPFAYEQQVVPNDAPPSLLASAIASMTSRLAVALDQIPPSGGLAGTRSV
jgi:hypothetical protein